MADVLDTTGKTLWELETPTSHVHGGMCDDVDPDQPGLECYAADKKPVDGKDQIIGRWFRSAAGKTLKRELRDPYWARHGRTI